MKRRIVPTTDLRSGATASDLSGRLLRIDRVSLATIPYQGRSETVAHVDAYDVATGRPVRHTVSTRRSWAVWA